MREVTATIGPFHRGGCGLLRATGIILPLLLGIACARARPPDFSDPERLPYDVQRALSRAEGTPEYYASRARLMEMGPELDRVLQAIVAHRKVKPRVRANALILLAERDAPGALAALRNALLTERNPNVRAAAVLGLDRLARDSDAAAQLIRAAVSDASRIVRLNALQSLDIADVQTLRATAQTERDPEVRMVARQLIAVAESRGAPLTADQRGALRTTGSEADPQIVFRPVRAESPGPVQLGDLRVELPNAPDLPLAPLARVVEDVVPAFFSLDRGHVVYEADGEIRVVDLASRSVRSLGPGTAPRPVPFSEHFIFLRERPREAGDAANTLYYTVYRAPFRGGAPERVGELRAEPANGPDADYSPVSAMVIAETPRGFVLRGEGITPFLLPPRVWESALQALRESRGSDAGSGGP